MMYFGGMGLFGGFSMLLFWGGFIWLIFWLIKQNNESRNNDYIDKNPLEIAKERYASGEITKKQFDQLKKDLR